MTNLPYFLKKNVKPVLPAILLFWAEVLLHYAQRLTRWYLIILNVHGVTFTDKLKILTSFAFSPITSLKKLMRWQNPVLLFDTKVNVPDFGIFTLRRYTDDLWHVFPSREPNILRSIYAQLNLGGCFIDAGANIGIYTMLASRLVGDDGHVVAVEMLPETTKILKSHIFLNQLTNILVIEKALSDIEGKVVKATMPLCHCGQASIVTGVSDNNIEILVRTTTLASILKKNNRVDLLKMDLEGAEELALIGAGDLLKRVQAIIFEDHKKSHLSNFISEKGFTVRQLDSNNFIAIRNKSA